MENTEKIEIEKQIAELKKKRSEYLKCERKVKGLETKIKMQLEKAELTPIIDRIEYTENLTGYAFLIKEIEELSREGLNKLKRYTAIGKKDNQIYIKFEYGRDF